MPEFGHMVRNADQGMQCVAAIPLPQQVLQRTLPTLERKVDDAIDTKPDVVDFVTANVQMIDSAGLNWLLGVLGRLDTLKIKMRIIDPSPIMADVLQATRLDSRFAVETSTPPAPEGGGNGS